MSMSTYLTLQLQGMRRVVFLVQCHRTQIKSGDAAVLNMIAYDLLPEFKAALSTTPVINKGVVSVRDIKCGDCVPIRIVQTSAETMEAIEHDHLMSDAPTSIEEVNIILIDTYSDVHPISFTIKATDLPKIFPLNAKPMFEGALEQYRTKVLPGIPPQIIEVLKELRDIYVERDPRCVELIESMIWRVEMATAGVATPKHLALVVRSVKDDIRRLVRHELYRHCENSIERGSGLQCEIEYRDGKPIRLALFISQHERREPTSEELIDELDRLGIGSEQLRTAVKTSAEWIPLDLKPGPYVEVNTFKACQSLLKLVKGE